MSVPLFMDFSYSVKRVGAAIPASEKRGTQRTNGA
jgi:hypothetical protein